MTDKLCSCGKPLSEKNETDRCYLCQQKTHRGLRLCACGCGETIDDRNASGFRRGHRFMSLVRGLTVNPAK